MIENVVTDLIQRKMAQPANERSRSYAGDRSLAKGLLAGLIGGVVATAAKTMAEKIYPPRTHGEPEPPDVLAEKIAGHPLSSQNREIASEAIHWGFGAVAGAAYGALAEFYPASTGKNGANNRNRIRGMDNVSPSC